MHATASLGESFPGSAKASLAGFFIITAGQKAMEGLLCTSGTPPYVMWAVATTHHSRVMNARRDDDGDGSVVVGFCSGVVEGRRLVGSKALCWDWRSCCCLPPSTINGAAIGDTKGSMDDDDMNAIRMAHATALVLTMVSL
jgi:hypothetical protein